MPGEDALAEVVDVHDLDLAEVLKVCIEEVNQQFPVLLRLERPLFWVLAPERRQRRVEFEGKPALEEEVDDLLLLLDRLVGERADEPDLKPVCRRDLIPPHGFLIVSLPSLCVGDRLGAVDAGTDGDMVFCKDLRHLRGEQPEVALQGERRCKTGEGPGEDGERLPVELRAGEERFPPVEGDGDLVGPVVLEPRRYLPDRLDTHDRRPFIRTPAVVASGRTTERGDDHDVKGALHCTELLLKRC
ncbi:hypothetical protein DSECCO2_657700 [anaerobic digester metagenome]